MLEKSSEKGLTNAANICPWCVTIHLPAHTTVAKWTRRQMKTPLCERHRQLLSNGTSRLRKVKFRYLVFSEKISAHLTDK